MGALCQSYLGTGIPYIKGSNYWSYERTIAFIHATAEYYWPVDILKIFLVKPAKDFPVYLAANKTTQRFKHTKGSFSPKSYFDLVSEICVTVTKEKHQNHPYWTIYDYDSVTGESFDDCISSISEIKSLSNNHYGFSNENVNELLRYNYFDKLNSKKFETQDAKTPKNPLKVKEMMKCLRILDKDLPEIPFITKEL